MFDAQALPVPDLGLSCRGCGYPLVALPTHRCPECGRAFTIEEHIPPGDFPPLIAGGREARNTPRTIALLRTYQIPYVERPDPMRSALGPLAMAWGPQTQPIAVPRDLYFEAVDLLRRQALGEPLPPPPSAPAPAASPWQCPRCRETVPANFAICWNCGHEAQNEAQQDPQ